MGPRIIMGLLGFAIIGIPMILLNLGALGRMAQVERAIQGETAVPGAIADAGIQVDNLFGQFVEGKEIDVLFDPNALARARHVIHIETVTLDDMLADGETRPDPALEELWVLARANARSMAECDVLLATIAKTCGVSKSEVDAEDDGTFEIETMISYTPSYYLGEIAVDGPKDLYTQRVRIPADRDDQLIRIADIPERRRALYEAAQQACRELRRTTQNCVISRITPRDSRLRDGEMTYYYLSVTLSYVGARAEGVDETLLGKFISSGASSPADAENRAGMLGGLLGGDDDKEEPASNRPSILRGGTGGQFQRPN
ncbi:MAG: hypothetical protein AAFN59_08710 [Pseudomonadota bacterium]